MNKCTWVESKRAIVVDFEGEGKRTDGSIPTPILLGAWGPFGNNTRHTYKAWLLRPHLVPMTRPRNLIGKRVVATIKEALEEILELAEKLSAPVAFYSEHELKIIRQEAPTLEDRLVAISVNVRTIAKSECTNRSIKLEEYKLAHVIRALRVATKPSVPPKVTAAGACRIIEKGTAKSRRWKSWPENARAQARELLRYNKEDVITTYKLLRHCCWCKHNKIR